MTGRHLRVVPDPYGDDGSDSAPEQPQCPRCQSWDLTVTSAGRWCQDCGLVSTGRPGEWDVMLAERLAWAEKKHPGHPHREAAREPLPVESIPTEGAPCQTCGGRHANHQPRREAPQMTRGRHAPRPGPRGGR